MSVKIAITAAAMRLATTQLDLTHALVILDSIMTMVDLFVMVFYFIFIFKLFLFLLILYLYFIEQISMNVQIKH
jgi:hypothetical protein